MPIVDVWAEYARLREEEGWTQEQIAQIKGTTQGVVSLRLKFHKLPQNIKKFIAQELLNEKHLREISTILPGQYLHEWLTSETAWTELAEWVAKGKKTTRETKNECDRWKAFIQEAEQQYQTFANQETTLYEFPDEGSEHHEPTPYPFDVEGSFVNWLAKDKTRSLSAVQKVAREVRKTIDENLTRYKFYIDQKSKEAAQHAKIPIAVLEYIGYSNEDISRLADLDNENDEYHETVPIVDVWAEYARLRDEEDWKNKQIARVKTEKTKKGKYQESLVSERLKWHDELPREIKEKVLSGILTEQHLRLISGVVLATEEMDDWLNDQTAWTELAEWAAKGKTTRETKHECDRWKAFIQDADTY